MEAFIKGGVSLLDLHLSKCLLNSSLDCREHSIEQSFLRQASGNLKVKNKLILEFRLQLPTYTSSIGGILRSSIYM